VPGIANDAFVKIAQATKDGCPVSKALKGNVKIELDAALS
jgi:osmotically inducible protein OsmC